MTNFDNYITAEYIAKNLDKYKRSGNGWVACCPSHEDNTPSLSISESDNGTILVHCFSGCSQELVIGTLKQMKLWPEYSKSCHSSLLNTKKKCSKVKDNKMQNSNIITLPITGEIPPPPTWLPKLGEATNTWEYTDTNGNPCFKVLRFETNEGKEIRPLTLAQIEQGLKWEWKWPGGNRPLYNLLQITNNLEATILITEGEKAADAAQRLYPECIATTSSGGSKAFNKTDWSPLKGKQIILWQDADNTGQAYIDNVAIILKGQGVSSIEFVDIKQLGLQGKEDAADFEAKGGTLPQIIEAIKPYVVYTSIIADLKAISLTDAEGNNKTAKSLLNETGRLFELFHDTNNETYAVAYENKKKHVFRIKSSQFRDYMAYCYYQLMESSPPGQTLSDSINTIDARAKYDSKKDKVYQRVGKHEDYISLDLNDDEYGNTIKITPHNWEIVHQSDIPINFIRSQYAIPQPLPYEDRPLETLLSELCNTDKNQLHLIAAWIIGAFRPNPPYPILVLHGSQGSGKSMLSKILKRIIDPNENESTCTPGDEKDLIAYARNHRLLSFDNNSFISNKLSDNLCRIASGASVSRRELYTTANEVSFKLARPILINGINVNIFRGDLLERSIVIELPELRLNQRKTEEEINNLFNELLPEILASICNRVSSALKNINTIHGHALPRMADFAKWVMASNIDKSEEFLKLYKRNIIENSENILSEDPLAEAIKYLGRSLTNQSKTLWEGTATQLLKQLNFSISDKYDELIYIQKSSQWPKDPRSLSSHLNRLSPDLKKLGIILSKKRVSNEMVIILNFENLAS